METSNIVGSSDLIATRSGSILNQSTILPFAPRWRVGYNYRLGKSLSDKEFKRIMIPAGPEDIANEVQKWQCRQSASKYARVAEAVRAGVGRMQRFSASIDMLAQGSPSPGCLLWGSIKFVLTVGIPLHSFPPTEIGGTFRGQKLHAYGRSLNAVNVAHGVV